MAKQQATLRQQLEDVEQRLAETLQVFAAYSTLNRCANKDTNAALNEIVKLRGGFWHAANVSFQTCLFIGIYALVESGPKVVTLATIEQRLRKEGKLSEPREIGEEIEPIRARYEKFRHTLFGHHGKDRGVLADRFDQCGFTWNMVEGDLATLEHAFKAMWLLADGKVAPSREESKRMCFPYVSSIKRSARDTAELLNDLQMRSKA